MFDFMFDSSFFSSFMFDFMFDSSFLPSMLAGFMLLIFEFDGLAATDGDATGDDAGDETVFVFDLAALLGALVLPASLGQAAPNKPNVKTAERAITFFI